MILEFGGLGGDEDFEISEGKGGLKYSCRPLQGMDIFWNHPMGDFNLNLASPQPDINTVLLTNNVHSYNLYQLKDSPTRITNIVYSD